MGWASGIPGDYARSLSAEFSARGVAQVLVSERPPENAEERGRFLSLLASATGVFFTGGDQNRAMEAIDFWNFRTELRSHFERGVPFAGTSAGTALMAQAMITGRESPRTSSGLGLFAPAVIDMHFLKRSREIRLIAAMESSGVPYGIGVDEDGALAIEDSVRAEVLGAPHVVFYEAKEGQILRYELQDREAFDLRHWRPE
jgi:cyanophycinase